MQELDGQVIRLAASRSGTEHHPLPQDAPRQKQPDIGLAKALLHREPTVDLETG